MQMEKKMDILETCMVVPSEETPKHGMWLSNLDLLGRIGHTPVVYVYRPNGETDFFSAELLKASLAKTLVHFYPLAGRLGLDRSGRIEINCTGEGVLFVAARTDSTVDDFGDFAPSQEMRHLLVPSALSDGMSQLSECPLAMFQVTFFKCGAVCLGTATSHMAADGLTALHLVNTWSQINRGSITKPDIPPFFDRTLLRARSPPTILFDHASYLRKTSATAVVNSATILKLSKHQIDHLKNTTKRKTASTFMVVAAHLWRCACKARGLAADEETRLYTAVDVRTRLSPPLPPGYTGNAIVRTSAAATAGEVMSKPLGFGVEMIEDATGRLDDEHLRSYIDFLEVNEEIRSTPAVGFLRPGVDVWVASWLGLPIYDADFGWGKPALVGRAAGDGLACMMRSPPGEDGGGRGVRLEVAMEPESMEKLNKVFYEELDAESAPLPRL